MKANEQINVLFIIVQMKMGGSEHLVLDLVRKLNRTEFAPHVAWFYEEQLLQQFVDLDVPLHYMPKVKRFDFSTMGSLSRTIKDNRIDVVNAHHFLSAIVAFYGCKLANRKRLIYTEHSTWEIDVISKKNGNCDAVYLFTRGKFRYNEGFHNMLDLEQLRRSDP